jgi:hypothetical protein
MEQQTFSYFVSLFFNTTRFLLFSFFLNYLLALAPRFYTATRCKALRKPTEQPVEPWYASLVGKIPTRCCRKVVAMAFKRCGKIYYVGTILKENKKDSTHESCVAAEKKSAKTLGSV